MNFVFNKLKTIISDPRIIFLDTDAKLPSFINNLNKSMISPSMRNIIQNMPKEVQNEMYALYQVNMTLCAGDGMQFGKINGIERKITDIEWFTRNIIGHKRNEKKTYIFCTTWKI